VKSITFRANEHLIERARLVARSQGKTLNIVFREWLEQFADRAGNVQEFGALMKRLGHIKTCGPFSREEMNNR
jgi:hypothetical protein